jgi:hypothetical protein
MTGWTERVVTEVEPVGETDCVEEVEEADGVAAGGMDCVEAVEEADGVAAGGKCD